MDQEDPLGVNLLKNRIPQLTPDNSVAIRNGHFPGGRTPAW